MEVWERSNHSRLTKGSTSNAYIFDSDKIKIRKLFNHLVSKYNTGDPLKFN